LEGTYTTVKNNRLVELIKARSEASAGPPRLLASNHAQSKTRRQSFATDQPLETDVVDLAETTNSSCVASMLSSFMLAVSLKRDAKSGRRSLLSYTTLCAYVL
jgi:hypothetical protein